MQKKTEKKLETQSLLIKQEHKLLDEITAEELAKKNFIFCNFIASKPVIGKFEDLEIFKAFSYSELFRELVSIDEKIKNSIIRLYLVNDDLQEEAFLKVRLC